MFVVYAMLAYVIMAMLVAALVLRRVRRKQEPEESFYAPAGASAPLAHLLHRVSLRGRRLRFYRSPLIGPDFPWAVLRDLFEIATDGASYNVTAEWVYANNPSLAQVVLTSDGPELLLSHWAASELLMSLVADPAERLALLANYREVMAEAYVLQWAGLSRTEFLDLCAAAERRPHAHAGPG